MRLNLSKIRRTINKFVRNLIRIAMNQIGQLIQISRKFASTMIRQKLTWKLSNMKIKKHKKPPHWPNFCRKIHINLKKILSMKSSFLKPKKTLFLRYSEITLLRVASLHLENLHFSSELLMILSADFGQITIHLQIKKFNNAL
jgi:hypothetical protein